MYNHLPPWGGAARAEPLAEAVVEPLPLLAVWSFLELTNHAVVGMDGVENWYSPGVHRQTENALRRNRVRGAVVLGTTTVFERRGGFDGRGSFRAGTRPNDRSFISAGKSCQVMTPSILWFHGDRLKSIRTGDSINCRWLVCSSNRQRLSASSQGRYGTETPQEQEVAAQQPKAHSVRPK